MKILTYLFLLIALLGALIAVVPTENAYAQTTPVTCQDANLSQRLDPEIADREGCPTRWVFQIWRLSMSVVNIGVVALIIVVGLATILHWNIDTYGFKKALPKIVVGVILANFSMLIVRGLVDLASILSATFVGDQGSRGVAEGIIMALFGTATAPAIGVAGYPILTFLLPGAFILVLLLAAIVVVVIPTIGVMILWFLLFIRVAIVLVFAAVAPLALVSMALPATQTWFQRWWGLMINWIFMAPVVFLLLRIASETGRLGATNTANPSFTQYLIPFIIACGALYLAIMTPFRMGGAIMATWNGLGRTAAGLGWKGYGSLGVKAKDWADDKNTDALTRNIGKAIVKTNLYGVRGAIKERMERAESYRESAFKESAVYKGISYDVAYRHHLQDKKEAVNAIEDPEVLQKRINDYLKDNPQLKTLSSEELQSLIYAGPGTQQKKFRQYGVKDPEHAAWFSLLMRRAQNLARRTRQPADLGRLLDDAADEKFADNVRAQEYKTDKEHPDSRSTGRSLKCKPFGRPLQQLKGLPYHGLGAAIAAVLTVARKATTSRITRVHFRIDDHSSLSVS